MFNMNSNGFIISAAFVLLLSAIVASDNVPSPSKKPVRYRNGLNPLLVKKIKIGSAIIRSDINKPSNENVLLRQRLNKKVQSTTEAEPIAVHQPNNNHNETGREIFDGPKLNRRVMRGDDDDDSVDGAGILINTASNDKPRVGSGSRIDKRPENQKISELYEERKSINYDNQTLPIVKAALVTPQSAVVPKNIATARITAANKENSNIENASKDESVQYKNKEVSELKTVPIKELRKNAGVNRKKPSTNSSKTVNRPGEDQSIDVLSARMKQDPKFDNECVSAHVTAKKDLKLSTKKSTRKGSRKGENQLNLNQRMKPVDNQKPKNNSENQALNVEAFDLSVDTVKPDLRKGPVLPSEKTVEAIVFEFPYEKKSEVNDNLNSQSKSLEPM